MAKSDDAAAKAAVEAEKAKAAAEEAAQKALRERQNDDRAWRNNPGHAGS